LNELIDNTSQKNDDRQCINKMHDFDIDIIWAIWILFSEKVHGTNLAKKA